MKKLFLLLTIPLLFFNLFSCVKEEEGNLGLWVEVTHISGCEGSEPYLVYYDDPEVGEVYDLPAGRANGSYCQRSHAGNGFSETALDCRCRGRQKLAKSQILRIRL